MDKVGGQVNSRNTKNRFVKLNVLVSLPCLNYLLLLREVCKKKLMSSVFTQKSNAAFIKFLGVSMQRLFEGGGFYFIH